jgi:hypothetical protein
MKYNEEKKQFESLCEINEIPIEVTYKRNIKGSTVDEVEDAMKRIYEVTEYLKTNLNKVIIDASEELIKKTFSEAEKVTKEDLISRLTLEDVTIYTHNTNLFFDDDGMFNYHTVIISMNENFEVTRTELFG